MPDSTRTGRLAGALVALLLVFGLPTGDGAAQSPSDDQIRQMIIQASREAYSGTCPCPYDRASNGSRCGGRSAWSRPGGASPYCYPDDVGDAMVDRVRAANGW